MEIVLFVSLLGLAAVVSLVLAFLFRQRREVEGSGALTVLMVSLFIWVASQALHVLTPSLDWKIFWVNLQYTGIVIIPASWLVLALQYTRLNRFTSGRHIFALAFFPLATEIVIWTNEYHSLFRTNIGVQSPPSLPILTSKFGPLFWIHTFYSYSLILLGTFLLVRKLYHNPPVYRNQARILLAAALTPLVGNAVFIFDIIPTYNIDPTPFTFILTGLLFFWGLYRFHLLDLVPAAREAVIESMQDLVITLDTHNRIIDINTSARNILGNGSTDFIGQPFTALLKDWPHLTDTYGSFTHVNEKITLHYEGSTFHFDLRISPLLNNRGKLTGRFVVLRDITDLENALQAAEASRLAAENANAAKSQFLATMSHEIRTPLNAIIGMSELLSSAQLTGDEKEYLKAIDDSANSLLKIINNILDYSKIEAEKMELEFIEFNLRDLMTHTVRTFSLNKQNTGVGVTCTLGENLPARLVGDQGKLRQILLNLIGNAVKFTHKGSITVAAEETGRDATHIRIRFSVTDTGIGIPKEKIGSLFESFHQLDKSTSRKYGGTGLGLAIVKSLVRMLNGQIHVESTPGQGSCFSFELPFQPAGCADSAAALQQPVWDFSSGNYHILLAEDNKTNQLLMRKILAKHGIQVQVAENGAIVLQRLASDRFDLILMDIQMPEMDGFEATTRIREKEAGLGRHIPIIALTANALKEDRDRCLAAGMDDFLTKPIKSATLYECLSRYLSQEK